jgi:hypothetical protein
MTRPSKEKAAGIDGLIDLNEILTYRLLAAEFRCSEVERRLSLVDGGDDTAAAVTAANLKVKAHKRARGIA